MENNLTIQETLDSKNLDKSKAKQIKEVFDPMVKMIEEFEKSFNDIVKKKITPEVTIEAKQLRKAISTIRIEAEKERKKQKEEYLRAGQAIDGVANILKWAVTEKENKLKEIEDHFIIIEQKRKEELQEKRVQLISVYVTDAHERNLSEMDDEVWNAYFNAKKKEHEDRIEAERQAEIERIAREKEEEEERKRIKAENERLRKEAEERERKEKEEELKREKERKELERKHEEALKKEREEKEAALKKIEEEKAREEAEKERLRLIEEERLRKEEEERENLKKAPDKEKLKLLSTQIKAITIPDLQSKEMIIVGNQVKDLLEKVVIFINQKIEK